MEIDEWRIINMHHWYRMQNEAGYQGSDAFRITNDYLAAYEAAKTQATEQSGDFTLLAVLADIRQKTGVGDKPMLSELASVLAERYSALDQTLDSMRQTNAALVKRLSEPVSIEPVSLEKCAEAMDRAFENMGFDPPEESTAVWHKNVTVEAIKSVLDEAGVQYVI